MPPCLHYLLFPSFSVVLAALLNISPSFVQSQWNTFCSQWSVLALASHLPPNFTCPCYWSLLFFWVRLIALHRHRPGYQAMGSAFFDWVRWHLLSNNSSHMVLKLFSIWPLATEWNIMKKIILYSSLYCIIALCILHWSATTLISPASVNVVAVWI